MRGRPNAPIRRFRPPALTPRRPYACGGTAGNVVAWIGVILSIRCAVLRIDGAFRKMLPTAMAGNPMLDADASIAEFLSMTRAVGKEVQRLRFD